VERPRVLDFSDQDLRLVLRSGELVRWRSTELEAKVVTGLSALSQAKVALSPDGVTLSEGARLFDSLTGKALGEACAQARCDVRLWSADGEAFITPEGALWPKPAAAAKEPLPLPEGFRALAFVGNARTLLVQRWQEPELFLLQPGQQPSQVSKAAELAAESRDQRVLVLRSDHGRSLQVLKAPKLEPLLPPLLVGGAPQVALSNDGRRLAFVDESNTLEVRDLSAPKAPGRRYFLRNAPGVFGISFDPSARFVLLHGAPLRFVRLSDGEILNLYVGYLDHIAHVAVPLLFVNEHDELDGDPALARVLFCDSRPEAATEPCRLPQRTPGIAQRFFEAH